MSEYSRRKFLQHTGIVTVGFLGLRQLLESEGWTQAADAATAPQPISRASLAEGYGDLVKDPRGLLDLPRGFSYHAFSRVGETMSDGLKVPGRHDGMAAFRGARGKTILVRNHEMQTDWPELSGFGDGNKLLPKVDKSKFYDYGRGKNPQLGGTTTLVYNTRQRVLESHFLSLAGTCRNCAGGPTPWNSWISCEETVMPSNTTDGGTTERSHGYNFEVPATAKIGLASPTPLRAMGRFMHEAIAFDAKSGAVYQTEDREDGLIYRFLPNVKKQLARGGKLQVLKFRDAKSVDTRNWEKQTVSMGKKYAVEWLDISDVESPRDDLRFRGFEMGAARFARGEGMWAGRDGIYFACTNGGATKKGQIWRYVPSREEGRADENRRTATLELFAEPNNGNIVDNADNITVAPWGDLIVCEDGSADQFLVGVTPRGKFYKLARNAFDDTELAGATFSPDGSTLFFNLQKIGVTVAVTGPWKSRVA